MLHLPEAQRSDAGRRAHEQPRPAAEPRLPLSAIVGGLAPRSGVAVERSLQPEVGDRAAALSSGI